MRRPPRLSRSNRAERRLARRRARRCRGRGRDAWAPRRSRRHPLADAHPPGLGGVAGRPRDRGGGTHAGRRGGPCRIGGLRHDRGRRRRDRRVRRHRDPPDVGRRARRRGDRRGAAARGRRRRHRRRRAGPRGGGRRRPDDRRTRRGRWLPPRPRRRSPASMRRRGTIGNERSVAGARGSARTRRHARRCESRGGRPRPGGRRRHVPAGPPHERLPASGVRGRRSARRPRPRRAGRDRGRAAPGGDRCARRPLAALDHRLAPAGLGRSHDGRRRPPVHGRGGRCGARGGAVRVLGEGVADEAAVGRDFTASGRISDATLAKWNVLGLPPGHEVVDRLARQLGDDAPFSLAQALSTSGSHRSR